MVQQLHPVSISVRHAPPPRHTTDSIKVYFPSKIHYNTKVPLSVHVVMLSQAHNKLPEHNTFSKACRHFFVKYQSKCKYHSCLSLSSNIISFMSNRGRRSRVHSRCCLDDRWCRFDGRQGSLSCGWV